MMCDIMRTLSEDGDMMGEGSIEDNNFEQLMVNMLDERDKLMETLRETQDNLSSVKITLKETELERDTLIREFDLVLGKVKSTFFVACFLILVLPELDVSAMKKFC